MRQVPRRGLHREYESGKQRLRIPVCWDCKAFANFALIQGFYGLNSEFVPNKSEFLLKRKVSTRSGANLNVVVDAGDS